MLLSQAWKWYSDQRNELQIWNSIVLKLHCDNICIQAEYRIGLAEPRIIFALHWMFIEYNGKPSNKIQECIQT